MAYAYAPLTNPRHTGSGIAPHVLLAPREWFAAGGIKKPIPGSTPGSEVTTTEAHTFKAGGYGFVRFLLSPEKNSYTAEPIGDKGHQKFNHTATIFVPGSYKEAHEQLKLFKNVPLLALVKDADCDAGIYYQLGNACMSAWLTTQFMTGTTVEGTKGYETQITFQSEYVQLYTGTIAMAAPMLPAPTGLVAANDGQNWELAWDEMDNTDGYEIYISRSPDMRQPVLQVSQGPASLVSATDAWSEIPEGTTYYFGVRSTTTDGSYRPGYWAVAMLQRPAAPVTLPAPTNLTLGVIGFNNANVSVDYDDESPATHIRTEVYTTADFTGSPVFTQEEALSFFGVYSVLVFGAGIVANTQYYIRFRLQAAGFTNSPWTTGTFTTLP